MTAAPPNLHTHRRPTITDGGIVDPAVADSDQPLGVTEPYVDRRYPTAIGFLPGAGAIVSAIAAAADAEPEVIGKPEPAMFEAILSMAGVEAADAVVIGDNPDADIVAARRAGIASVLVLTGVADRRVADALTGDRRPDAVVEGPAEAATLLAGLVSR